MAKPPADQVYASRPVQTIEKTSKKWKALQGCGCLTAIIGLVVFGAVVAAADKAAGREQATVAVVAVWAAVGGIGAYVFGRIGAWWFHG